MNKCHHYSFLFAACTSLLIFFLILQTCCLHGTGLLPRQPSLLRTPDTAQLQLNSWQCTRCVHMASQDNEIDSAGIHVTAVHHWPGARGATAKLSVTTWNMRARSLAFWAEHWQFRVYRDWPLMT